MGRIYDDITQTIGHTPLVKLTRVNPVPQVEIFVKCEFLNPRPGEAEAPTNQPPDP